MYLSDQKKGILIIVSCLVKKVVLQSDIHIKYLVFYLVFYSALIELYIKQ